LDFNLTIKPGLVLIAMEIFQCNYILGLAFVNKNFVTINYILNQGTILLFISGGDAY